MRALRRCAANAGARLAGARQLSSKTKPLAPHPFDSFLSGNSSAYIEDMYHAWKQVSTGDIRRERDSRGARSGRDAGVRDAEPPGVCWVVLACGRLQLSHPSFGTVLFTHGRTYGLTRAPIAREAPGFGSRRCKARDSQRHHWRHPDA